MSAPKVDFSVQRVMAALHVALTASPVDTWDAAETARVLDVVQQIVADRDSRVALFPYRRT
jgi:hypothetical protein